MTLYSLLFYLLAIIILASTVMAVTRRNLVHAIIYLVVSFFGSAMLFYLLGAPFLAAIEVIIYAGAIMILFLFIVMMIDVDRHKERLFPIRQCLPALIFGLVYAAVGLIVTFGHSGSKASMPIAVATPNAFGRFVFEHHWLAVEIVSLLLLVALVGALYLGRLKIEKTAAAGKETP